MDEQLVFRHILREPAQPPKEQMNATDFQQLADRITQFFSVELHEEALSFLAQAQEELEEAERNRQRNEIRRLSEELWHRKEGG
jgi:hypothetical protein